MTARMHTFKMASARMPGVGRGTSTLRGAARAGAARRLAMGASVCTASALGAVALGAGFAGPASAATARRVVVGTVGTPGASSFTVESGVATITVDVVSTTRYHDLGVAAPTFANVTTGEHVRVLGTMGGSDLVDATSVQVLPIVVGKVVSTASLTTGSFTLGRGAATITVDVSSTTTYLDHGASPATVANVTDGERVEVFGTVSGTNTVEASVVRAVPARRPYERRPGRREGQLGR